MHKFTRVSIALCLLGAASHAGAANIEIDGQIIPGSDVSGISIVPSSGNVIITTIDGYTITKNGGGGGGGSDVVINTFTTTKSTFVQGGNATLNWTTSNASSCSTSGGTSGWNAHVPSIPNGSKYITTQTVKNFIFTLNCSGSNGSSASKSVSINVTSATEPPPEPTPTNCGSSPLSGTTETWASFWGVSFPFPVYANEFFTIPRTGYKALIFNTGNFVDNGKFTTIETTQTDGVRIGAVSECPGDFNVPASCTYTWGIGGGLRWATDGRTDACQLDSNTTYYFNVTFTDGENSNTSTCTESPCITELQHTNF